MKPINKKTEGDLLFYVEVESMSLYVYAKKEDDAKAIFIKYLSLKKKMLSKISIHLA